MRMMSVGMANPVTTATMHPMAVKERSLNEEYLNCVQERAFG